MKFDLLNVCVYSLIVWAFWYGHTKRNKQKKEFKSWARQHYADSAKVVSENPRYVFDPKVGHIVKDEEEYLYCEGKIIGYTLTRIATNQWGEYFWFRIDSGAEPQMMSRHMDYGLAKVLLKDKFVLPKYENAQG